jgi:hypothetical protein
LVMGSPLGLSLDLGAHLTRPVRNVRHVRGLRVNPANADGGIEARINSGSVVVPGCRRHPTVIRCYPSSSDVITVGVS